MNKSESSEPSVDDMPGWLYAAGVILTIAYPVLAFSIGFRAVYRLGFKDDVSNYLPPALSLLTAIFYLFATIGFAKKAKWAWRLSIISLGLETFFTFVVGGLSLAPAFSELIGRTAWRAFGADYGYLPLIQPIVGLIWLLHPATRRAYQVDKLDEQPDREQKRSL